MITLTCDNCEKAFEVDDDAAGGKASCPYCGDIKRVPGAAATAARPGVPAHVQSAAAGPASNGEESERLIKVVRQGMFRAHPFWYSLMVLIGIAGVFLAVMAGTTQEFANKRWLMWVGVALAGVAILWWIGWWAAPHRWIKLTITNKRTIRQEGIVVRKTSEVMHRHVTSVMIRQGFMDRILNVGYIGIDSAGQGGEPAVGKAGDRTNIEIEVEHIPKPYEVKKIIDQYRLGAG